MTHDFSNGYECQKIQWVEKEYENFFMSMDVKKANVDILSSSLTSMDLRNLSEILKSKKIKIKLIFNGLTHYSYKVNF